MDPAVLSDRLAAALGAGPAPASLEPPQAAAPAPQAPQAPRAPVARRRTAPVPVPAPAGGPANDRRAAADALRARADELRRGAVSAAVAAAVQDAVADSGTPGDSVSSTDAALAELATPVPGDFPALDLETDPGLEAILRRAEEAEAKARRGARRAADDGAARAAAAEAEARRLAEQTRRAEEEIRRAEAEAEATRAAEERRRAEEEEAERSRDEARRAAQAQADAEAEAARAAEERRRAEGEERRRLEAEAARARETREHARLRRELDAERRASDERARAAAEGRRSEEDGPRASGSDEEKLRAAIRSAREEMEALRRSSGAEEEQLRAAIESARAEMETLRRRGDEESRRRAEAEAEVARLAREAERREAEASTRPPPLEVPVYQPPVEDPAPDPAQEIARRRVAALRDRTPAPLPAPPPAPEEPARAPVRTPPPELRSGTLGELPMPRLLALAARAGLAGRVDLEGEAARSIYFEDGRVVGATSSAPGERIEEVALRLGLVTRDQHRLVAASAAPLATRRAAVLLLERGFLKPAELGPLVRRRTEEVVFGAFGDPGARFRWSAAEVPPDESTALERSTLQLAVEGVRRRWLAPEVDAVLGSDATLVAPVPTGPGAADLGLSPEERRVLALADGLRTLDEIVAGSPLDPLSTRQVLAALVLVGTLAVRTFQGGRPAAAAAAAIDLARVRDKLDQVRRADYFAVLGVGRLCTPHEVREAFERLRLEFDPRRFQGVREDGLEGRLEEIQRVVADARDVLADDRLRAEYLRGLGE